MMMCSRFWPFSCFEPLGERYHPSHPHVDHHPAPLLVFSFPLSAPPNPRDFLFWFCHHLALLHVLDYLVHHALLKNHVHFVMIRALYVQQTLPARPGRPSRPRLNVQVHFIGVSDNQ